MPKLGLCFDGSGPNSTVPRPHPNQAAIRSGLTQRLGLPSTLASLSVSLLLVVALAAPRGEEKLLAGNSSVASPGMDLLGLGHMSILESATETKRLKSADWPHLDDLLTL